MLAIVVAQAALAHSWHPGADQPKKPWRPLAPSFDHEDVIGALMRKIEVDERQARLLRQRLEL
jgi:hypothetical protein